MSRWAVPVFIMITGALLLSDPRVFEVKYCLLLLLLYPPLPVDPAIPGPGAPGWLLSRSSKTDWLLP